MREVFEGITLPQIARELERLAMLAHVGERPKPTRINPPDHPMPGFEWVVREQDPPYSSRRPVWTIRTVDDPEYANSIFLSSPDCTNPGEDFTPLDRVDSVRLALAILAAVDRSAHVSANVPRLEDRQSDE